MDPALLAPIDADRLAALRSEWAWLVPAELRTVGVSRLGDWLFEGADGVHVLDTVEGRLIRTEGRDWEDVLLEGLVQAVLKGRRLPGNHCVGFRVPPILGGPTDVSNLEIVPIERYQVWTARLHRARAGLPVGARVTRVEVDDDGGVRLVWEPGGDVG